MRLPKPKFQHPPEVYRAIIDEHRHDALRVGERLMACGWTLADAAWAAVSWDLCTLAAAIVNERFKRDTKPTGLSDGDLAKLKAEIDAAQKPPPSKSKRTPRFVQVTPRLPRWPPARAGKPEA